MTIKNRNRALNILAIVLFLFSVSLFVPLVLGFLNNTLAFYPSPTSRVFRNFPFFDRFPALLYQPYAVVAAICEMGLFAIITTIIILIQFQKTHASEIIYFSAFIISCAMEQTRLLTPIMNLWDVSMKTLFLISKFSIFARTLAPLSLMAAALFNDVEERQFTERNFLILILVSIIVAQSIPLSTVTKDTCFIFQIGQEKLFFAMRTVAFCITIIGLLIRIYGTTDKTTLIKETIGCSLLYIGYCILCITDNYVFLGEGTLLLIAGAIIYLKNMHKLYLWK